MFELNHRIKSPSQHHRIDRFSEQKINSVLGHATQAALPHTPFKKKCFYIFLILSPRLLVLQRLLDR
jgi:hypothetical protein